MYDHEHKKKQHYFRSVLRHCAVAHTKTRFRCHRARSQRRPERRKREASTQTKEQLDHLRSRTQQRVLHLWTRSSTMLAKALQPITGHRSRPQRHGRQTNRVRTSHLLVLGSEEGNRSRPRKNKSVRVRRMSFNASATHVTPRPFRHCRYRSSAHRPWTQRQQQPSRQALTLSRKRVTIPVQPSTRSTTPP